MKTLISIVPIGLRWRWQCLAPSRQPTAKQQAVAIAFGVMADGKEAGCGAPWGISGADRSRPSCMTLAFTSMG